MRFLKLGVFILPLVASIAADSQAVDLVAYSKWDEDILKVEYHQVRIQADNIVSAWQSIGTKYLLRANLVVGAGKGAQTAKFSLITNNITGNDLVNAFCDAYPEYTSTRDKETGILWFHPKSVRYEDILNQKVNVANAAYQIPMFAGVYLPLCELLAPKLRGNQLDLHFGPPENWTYDYNVDLPAGNHNVRDIFNFCCINNPTKCFYVIYGGAGGNSKITPVNLYSGNPLSVRAAAVRFWEIEFGKSTNGVPSTTEVIAAMSDMSARKRWAARAYLEAALQNYQFSDLIANHDSPEKAVWAELGIQSIVSRGRSEAEIKRDEAPGFVDSLGQVRSPGLALLMVLELTRQKQNTAYLEDIVVKHKFSELDIAAIKLDAYRIVRSSKLALNKLKALNLKVPEFSPEILHEMGSEKIFTVVSPGKD